jgi:ABC-type transport system substrate-binding protein
LDPDYAFFTQDTGYLHAVFQNLVEYNVSSGTVLEPVVADQYWITNGGCTNVFHIRPGVTFSDGTPVSAYDEWFAIVRTQYANTPSGISYSNWLGVSYNETAGAQFGSGSYEYLTFGDQFPWGLRIAIQAATGLQTAADTPAAVNLAVDVLDQMLSNFNPANATQDAIMSYPQQAYVANATFFTANYLRTLGPFGPQLWAGWDGEQIIEPAFVDAHGGVENNTVNSYISTEGGIGTGAYEIKSVGVGMNPIVLVATPNYWAGKSTQTFIPADARPASINTIIMNVYATDTQAVEDFGTNKAQLSTETPNEYNAMYDALPAAVRSHFTFNQIFRGIGSYQFAVEAEFDMNAFPTNNTDFRKGMAYAINYTAFNEPNVFNGTAYYGYYVGPLIPDYAYYNPENYPLPAQNTTAALDYFQQFGMQTDTYMLVPASFTLSNGTTLSGGTVIGDSSGNQLQPIKLYYEVPLTAATEVQLEVIQQDLAQFGVDAIPFGATASEIGILDTSPQTFPAFQLLAWGADFNDPFLGMFFPLMTSTPYNGFFDNATVNTEALTCEFPATTAQAQTCASVLYKMAYDDQIWIYNPIPEIPAGQPNAGWPTNFFFIQPYLLGMNRNQYVGVFYNQLYYAPVNI